MACGAVVCGHAPYQEMSLWNLGVRLSPAVESTMDECVSVTKSELTTASVVYLPHEQPS